MSDRVVFSVLCFTTLLGMFVEIFLDLRDPPTSVRARLVSTWTDRRALLAGAAGLAGSLALVVGTHSDAVTFLWVPLFAVVVVDLVHRLPPRPSGHSDQTSHNKQPAG